MHEVKVAYTAAELEKIIKLRYAILREPWQQDYNTATDELEQESINCFISDAEGQVIACGRLQENAGRTGQIRYMAVNVNYQGKGLGKKIVYFLEAEAKNQGLKKIELQARENAVKFYNDLGYIIKEKTFLLWGVIQHYLMVKEL